MKLVFRICVLFVCLFVLQTNAFAIIQPTTCPSTTPVIDGVLSPGEWDAAYTVDIQVNLPEGGTEPGRIYVMNDANYLYVAFRMKRAIPDPGSNFFIKLDANYDGHVGGGDDVYGTSHTYTEDRTVDEVYWVGGKCPPGRVCGAMDETFGGTNDVTAAFGADGTFMTYELAKPLMVDDPNDATMSPGSSIGMAFSLSLLGWTANAYTYYPTYPNGLYGLTYLISDCGPMPF